MPIRKYCNPVPGKSRRILVADADSQRASQLQSQLQSAGYRSAQVTSLDQFLCELNQSPHAIVVVDFEMGSDEGLNGLSIVGHMLLEGHNPSVVLVVSEITQALKDRCERLGSIELIERTPDVSTIVATISGVDRDTRRGPLCGTPFLGDCSAVRDLREVIRNVAFSDAPVLITGESGTGKELVARAVHDCGHRSAGPFVPVNMAALPESLVESVLFGHEKGSFTGADRRQTGMCEQANHGTLFLDEIGEMNREVQPKLLRFLQEYTVQRVGSSRDIRVNTRVVSATNRSVADLSSPGVLREDLFFRLHVVPIHVPSLRERADDIPLLAKIFLAKRCQQTGRHLSFADATLNRFREYTWPGNIRQLENLVHRLVATIREGEILPDMIPAECLRASYGERGTKQSIEPVVSPITEPMMLSDRQLTRMESFERKLIIEALHQMDGNVGATARFLGVGQATIYRKMRTLEIPKLMSGTHGRQA